MEDPHPRYQNGDDGLVEAMFGPHWKRKLPVAVLTSAPTAYVVVSVYLRTRSIGLAFGAGVLCPLVVYAIFKAWLDETSRFTKTSWARWSANHADHRPLIAAAVGAVVFTAVFALMSLALTAVGRA